MNLFGCLFSHPHQFLTRNTQGELCLQCDRCWKMEPVLHSAVIPGPAHQQKEVAGKPEYYPKTEATKSKIRSITQGSRRS